MSLESFLIKNISYPLYLLYKGNKNRGEFFNIGYFKYLKKHELFSKEIIKEIQMKKLFDIVDYAVKNIPFYNEYWRKNVFNYSQSSIYEDIKKLPLLGKEILQKEFNKLYRIRDIDYIYNTSGGLDGEPVNFIQDLEHIRKKNTLYADNMAGFNIGDKVIKLKELDDSDIEFDGSLRNKVVYNLITRIKNLNTIRMAKKDIKDYIDRINQYKPKFIMASVKTAYILAEYINDNGLTIYHPESIIISTGTLSSEHRKKIERTFGCNVYSRYEANELGIVAMECDRHEGLHLSSFNHYVEILKEDGTEARDGEMGELVITVLTNYTMPLIRYRIGDMAIQTYAECSCGRGFPLIKLPEDDITARLRAVDENWK